MIIQIGGLTIEAGRFFSVRLSNGAEVLFERCAAWQRGLWATERLSDGWRAWAGLFSVIVNGPVRRPIVAV